MRILGVDWSGAEKSAGKKVWLAHATATGESLHVDQVVRAADPAGLNAQSVEQVLDGLVSLLTDAAAPNWAGFDFAFSLPAPLIKSLGLKTWQDFASAIGQKPYEKPDDLRTACRLTSSKEIKRQTDIRALTAWSPYNLRMVAQTFHGIRLLQRIRVTGARILPFDAPDMGSANIVEICPSTTLEAVGLRGIRYKANNSKEGRAQPNWQRCHAREAILDRFVDTWNVTLADGIYDTVIADHEGDALDAILAVVSTYFDAARHGIGWHGSNRVSATSVGAHEGWIYSDPVSRPAE